ncbi:MAG TPA: hypothetical protein VG222_19465 [Vicinamibacterales bacterium]|jgi:hypothetical protein|nr:hypothetical protein [Vicinamibacterales bacterium]
MVSPKIETGHAPKDICTLPAIGLFDLPLEKHVQVIGHEAECNNFNAQTFRRTQKLLAYAITDDTLCEVRFPLERAHREENPLRADVAGVMKAQRAAARHAGR